MRQAGQAVLTDRPQLSPCGKMESIAMDRPEASSAQIPPKDPLISHERRRARRHKMFTPAYANRSGSSQGVVLELSEILNLSESGMCLPAPSPMEGERPLPLGIDLAGSREQIR